MQTLSLVWGILAILGMLVGLFPCLGSLNWLNIPFSIIGLIISAVGLSRADSSNKNTATAGLVLCIIALVVGMIRLVIGGGVL